MAAWPLLPCRFSKQAKDFDLYVIQPFKQVLDLAFRPNGLTLGDTPDKTPRRYQFRRQLVPLVAPKYAVRLAVTMVTDRVPAHELGIMYPDVEVIRPQRSPEPSGTAMPAAAAIPPAPVAMPIEVLVPTRLVTVEVHDVAQNTLVT